jgi:Flp pilus assembly protein TadD
MGVVYEAEQESLGRRVALNLGGVLAKQGRTEEALMVLRQATRLDPRIAEAHHNLGNLLFTRGNCGKPARLTGGPASLPRGTPE